MPADNPGSQKGMCDTFAAAPDATQSGAVILAKNSDREPNEAQAVELIRARDCTEKTLKATYIEIPQVTHTHEVILSRPFWMWGAEMGVNEKGVAIGNEAVFSKISLPKKNNGLLGMDLLRLALERADTAQNALNTITDLLSQYGQDAMAGYLDKGFYYHNSFLIADPSEAYILETVDRQWAVRRIKKSGSISNCLTLEGDLDASSSGLLDYAKKAGLVGSGAAKMENFRAAFSDRFFTFFARGHERRKTTGEGLLAEQGRIAEETAMKLLRSHGKHDSESFEPSRSSMAAVCLHAKGPVTPSQTTGSMVAVLRKNSPHSVWLTGSSAPCLSLFKPVYFGGVNPAEMLGVPSASALDGTYFWRHEKLHREALLDYPAVHAALHAKYAELEASFLAEERKNGPSADLSRRALQAALDTLAGFERELRPVRRGGRWLYRAQWKKWNRLCGMAEARS